MDLMDSINFALSNSTSSSTRDDSFEDSLFTPPPMPEPRRSKVFVSVPPFPAGLTRDSYHPWPRSLKRARTENGENREYAKYDTAADQTTLSVGWLDEQLDEAHPVQAVNLSLRGFTVDIRAPKTPNHAFYGFPLANDLEFGDTHDIKTCAMSGWDGLPSPSPSQSTSSKSATPPPKPTSPSKLKRVYTVFDSETESQQSNSRTQPHKKPKPNPKDTFEASLSAAYNQTEPQSKHKRPVKRMQPSQGPSEDEYQYALGEPIPFVDDPKHLDDDYIPTGKPKKKPKMIRDSITISQKRLDHDLNDDFIPGSTMKSTKKPALELDSVNGKGHDGNYIRRAGKARRVVESEDEDIPNTPPPNLNDTTPKPLRKILPSSNFPMVPLKVGPPPKQSYLPPRPPFPPSASGSNLPFPIGPPVPLKRRNKIPPPAANIVRPRFTSASYPSPAAPPSHHSYHPSLTNPLFSRSESHVQSAMQSVLPGAYLSAGPSQVLQRPPIYGHHFGKPPSRFGSDERQKRRGFYPPPVSASTSWGSDSGSMGTSASFYPNQSVPDSIPYSSYSSLVNGGVAANGTLIVRNPHQQQGSSQSLQSGWWSWTPVGSPSHSDTNHYQRGGHMEDVEMQNLEFKIVKQESEDVFGNGTIDPSVLAPQAPADADAGADDAGAEIIDVDADAEGDTDPEMYTQSPEPEPAPTPKRIRKPLKRYGEEATLRDLSPSSNSPHPSPSTKTKANADVGTAEIDPNADPLTPGKPSGPFPLVDVIMMDKTKSWPTGDDDKYCHCCRRRIIRAQMHCGNPDCDKSFCCRCLAVRFPYLKFNAKKKDWECVLCLGVCTCDKCSEKRGEPFYPIRAGKLVDPTVKKEDAGGEEKMSTRILKKSSAKTQSLSRMEYPSPSSRLKGKALAVAPPDVPEEEPLVFRDIEEPTQHWGLIYDSTYGRRIGEAFTGIDGRDDVVLGKWDFPPPKPPLKVQFQPLWVTARMSKRRQRKQKRVFVGKIQDEVWGECVGVREHPEDDEDEEEGDGDGDGEVKKDVVGYRRPGTISQDGKVVTWYVGKKGPLSRRPASDSMEDEDEDKDKEPDADADLQDGAQPPAEENLPLPKVEDVPLVSCSVPIFDTDSPLTVLDSNSGEGEYCVRFGGEDSDVYIKSPTKTKRNGIEAAAETHTGGLDHNAILTAIVLGLKEVGVDPIYCNV